MVSITQTNPISRAAEALREKFGAVVREFAKFGIVGLVALVVDISTFNLLRFAGGEGPFYDRPISAKVVSVAVATTVAYFGNRFWTFRHRGRTNMGREYLLFFVFNGIALLIAIGCLWLSHYMLKFDSPLADNISANVIGLGLGTLFRFWSYSTFVFPKVDDPPAEMQEHRHECAPAI